MKIDTHNSLGHRFSSISDINRLIAIDYYRLQSSLAIIEFHRLDQSRTRSLALSIGAIFLLSSRRCTENCRPFVLLRDIVTKETNHKTYHYKNTAFFDVERPEAKGRNEWIL